MMEWRKETGSSFTHKEDCCGVHQGAGCYSVAQAESVVHQVNKLANYIIDKCSGWPKDGGADKLEELLTLLQGEGKEI